MTTKKELLKRKEALLTSDVMVTADMLEEFFILDIKLYAIKLIENVEKIPQPQRHYLAGFLKGVTEDL